jgi:hypothetical protein
LVDIHTAGTLVNAWRQTWKDRVLLIRETKSNHKNLQGRGLEEHWQSAVRPDGF